MMDKARGPGLVSRVAVGPAAGWCLSGGVACARVRSKLFMKDQKRKVHMAHKLSTKLNHKEHRPHIRRLGSQRL